MNKVLLVAHAPLAQSMRLAGLHVFADLQAHIAAVDISPQSTLEASQAEVLQAWRALQTEDPKSMEASGTGTLVLVDVFGATPCNAAMQALQGMPNTKWLAGFNLPMLLKVLNKLNEPLEELVQAAQVGGMRGICVPPKLKDTPSPKQVAQASQTSQAQKTPSKTSLSL